MVPRYSFAEANLMSDDKSNTMQADSRPNLLKQTPAPMPKAAGLVADKNRSISQVIHLSPDGKNSQQ